MTGIKGNVRRTGALFMAAFILTVMVLSSFFIAIEVHHHCCEEDCPVCDCIKQCHNTLKSLGSVTPAAISVFIPIISVLFAVSLFTVEITAKTPVSRKVRLND